MLGRALPRGPAALGELVVRVRALLRLRPRGPSGDLLDERDREPPRPHGPTDPSRGHSPTKQAAMKCLYLMVRSLDPTGRGSERWMNRWKPALNAFAITFEGRLFRQDQ